MTIGVSSDPRDTEVLELRAKLESTQRRLRIVEALFQCVPGVLWELWFQPDPKTGERGFVSNQIISLTGYTPEEWFSTPTFWIDVVVHPDDRERVKADKTLYIQGSSIARLRWLRKDGGVVWVEANMTLIRNEEGKPIGVRGVNLDITATVRAETERSEALLREERLRMQKSMLLELSTPLIPLNNEILVMPLVGALERARAERATEALLEGVTRLGARFVILDITGVARVDADVANSLLQAARGVGLLGAEVILTGIRPEVARTLVELGVDLGQIATKSSLQAGISHATAQKARRNA